MQEAKARVPKYRAGDLVQFEYDSGTANKKWKRIVCVETILNDVGEKEWQGWYTGHVVYDQNGNYEEHNAYKLEDFVYRTSERILISRIG